MPVQETAVYLLRFPIAFNDQLIAVYAYFISDYCYNCQHDSIHRYLSHYQGYFDIKIIVVYNNNALEGKYRFSS